MTRYNPFAYGEVRLDPNQQKGAAPGDAEDVLFAEGEQVKQGNPADASWALLNEDVDDLLPGSAPADHVTEEFGAEILGECGASANAGAGAGTNDYASEALLSEPAELGVSDLGAMLETPVAPSTAIPAAAAPAAAASALAPDPTVAATSTATAREPSARRSVQRRPVGKGARATPSESRARRGKRRAGAPVRRRSRVLAGMVPLILCVGGGTAASWFWVMQSNPVMAGILGATTLVGALFSWLFLRG